MWETVQEEGTKYGDVPTIPINLVNVARIDYGKKLLWEQYWKKERNLKQACYQLVSGSVVYKTRTSFLRSRLLKIIVIYLIILLIDYRKIRQTSMFYQAKSKCFILGI